MSIRAGDLISIAIESKGTYELKLTAQKQLFVISQTATLLNALWFDTSLPYFCMKVGHL